PNDGGDFRLRSGGAEIFSVVTTDSPASVRELTPDAAYINYTFPTAAGDIIISSIVIYKDGVAYAKAEDGDGTYIPLTSYTTYTNNQVKPRTFTYSDDDTMGYGDVRRGGFLPDDGEITNIGVSLVPTGIGHYSYENGGTHYFQAGETRAPSEDVHLSKLKDGRRYFWVNIKFGSFGNYSNVKNWKVTGRQFKAITLSTSATGATVATFPDAVAAGVKVTATYKTTSVSGDFKYLFRKGEKDQDPIAFDEDESGGARNTYNVALKLDEATARSYSTSADVDDVIVGLESAPDGFYSFQDGGFAQIHRNLLIAFKETAAADSGATTKNDPSTGWVPLKDPATGWDFFAITANATGTVQWFKSIADLFAYTKTSKYDASVRNHLPLKAYDVKITATDAQDTLLQPATIFGKGKVLGPDTTRFHSELYFATATELQRIGFVLPPALPRRRHDPVRPGRPRRRGPDRVQLPGPQGLEPDDRFRLRLRDGPDRRRFVEVEPEPGRMRGGSHHRQAVRRRALLHLGRYRPDLLLPGSGLLRRPDPIRGRGHRGAV
ncbi:MAG: hypothetical protein ACYS5V_08500, partial [Planctomycetota bacterium]